jgi:phosphonoacetaldehyde hydrolase
VPKNVAVAARYADLIPGAAEAARSLRDLAVKIGTTTGYTHEIMDEIAPVAARQGFAPDCIVCTGDAPDGRPTPFLLYRALLDLAVWPAAACIKIDDTEVGIAEGLNAGCWTVGVAVTGNLFGLSLADTAALTASAFQARRAGAAAELAAAGAHYVIDGVADLLPIVAEIEGRLARGERP